MAEPSDSGYEAVRALFLRLLGLVYLAAFLSLAVQVEGLIGSRGVLPAQAFLDWVRGQTGTERYWLLPTLFWLDAGDLALKLACWSGAVLSCLLVAGIAPAPLLAVLWALYLSLTNAGQIFLAFQWDNLLLETGLLAVFFAPLGRRGSAAPWLVLWLLRWLLFRLMFSSGVVKLLSGDPTWRELTALRYHYWTQPLPTVLAWYAHRVPDWFHTASCVVMFAVELAVPFLIFGPRRVRQAAAAVLVALQLLIAATGNYAFFNLLTVVLCLVLLDDAGLPRRLRERWSAGPRGGREWPPWVLWPVAALVALLSTMQMAATVGLRFRWPAPALAVYRASLPFHAVDSYGLFAVMTTTRPEIVVEGSADGFDWKPYEFRAKPGDPDRAPAFLAPHQPRLDWQMWFAALGTCEQNRFVLALLGRLAEGSPPVVKLLRTNPFPAAPPRFVRATLYDYHFGPKTWWQREMRQLYCPAVSLTD